LAVPITDADFGEGGLRHESFARPGKLFTANESLVVGTVGHLRGEKHRELVSAIVNLLNSGVREEAG
jgi:mRNA interferase MazF